MRALHRGWAGVACGMLLLILLTVGRLPDRPSSVVGQDPNLAERVQQLEGRLALVEARLIAVEAAVPSVPGAPGELITAYRTTAADIIGQYTQYQQQVAAALAGSATPADLQMLLDQGAALYRFLAVRIRSLNPPPCFATAQAFLLQAAGLLDAATAFGLGSVTTSSTETLLAAAMLQAQQALAAARCAVTTP
jgi:hypothetical protein